jgi:hypothetical protein
MSANKHPDLLLILGTLLVAAWVYLLGPLSPFSAETAVREALSDFSFPDAPEAASVFDGQTDVRVDWNYRPDPLFASGDYPALVTLRGAVPDRLLSETEKASRLTFTTLYEGKHVREAVVAIPIHVRRQGLYWEVSGLSTPDRLLEDRIKAVQSRASSGAVHFVADHGLYGETGVFVGNRQGMRSIPGLVAFAVCLGIFFGRVVSRQSMGGEQASEHGLREQLVTAGCLMVLSFCLTRVLEAAFTLLALTFS